MIDTHTHIYLPYEGEEPGDEGPDGRVSRAVDEGVVLLVYPNIDLESVAPLLRSHRRHPEITRVAYGLHPTEVRDNWRDEFREIRDLFSDSTPVAVGEIGIDLYWDKTYRRQQIEAFAYQVDEASRKGLPVIIHQREALDEVLEVVKHLGSEMPPAIFHSFTSSPDQMLRILEAGDFMVGINGVVTFKKAHELREAVRLAGLDRILLETDSPYLSPEPKRGRPNESANLRYIAAAIASALSTQDMPVTPGNVAEATTVNARRILHL